MLPATDVAWRGVQVLEVRHGVYGGFDALARAEQAPSEQQRPAPSGGRAVGAAGVTAPWGIIVTFDGSTSKRLHNRRRAVIAMTTTTLAAFAIASKTFL